MATSDSISIQMLGGWSVHRAGLPIRLPTRKAAALLAILALRPGTTISRERLADLLWSRSAEPQARGSLRQALAHLRRTLETGKEPIIEADSAGLRLSPAQVEVDTAELEAALVEGCPSALERAAAQYSGDFLEGFILDEGPFEEWRRAETERLRRQALTAFGRQLQRYVEAAEVESAMALGERLLLLDPVAEETYQALMRLHLGRGALGSAMREYQRCRAALSADLGVPPAAETEALRRQIRAHSGPATAQETDGPPLVAVLPFANLADEPAQVYFAQGFTEDVIRELTRFRSLRVMAAHSTFAAANPKTAPREIGERLGARYLLSGSVRRSARSVRIGAELLNAQTGHYLWSHRYDVPPESLFETQDEIARGVASALAVRIDDERLKQAARKPLDNLEAYDCWLRGLACLRRGTPESLAEARPLFHRALESDPSFARAYSGLSLTYFNEWSCTAWDRWDENERMAFEYAQRGAAMDDSDHMTRFILGRILLYRREFERAERHLERAEALNPNDADMLAQLALSDVYLGRPERGVERVRLAMRLNPFHDDWYFAFAAGAYLLVRRLHEAIELAVKAPHVATDVHAWLAAAYAHLGQPESARHHLLAFLNVFRRKITFGREPAPDEPARWVLHVNPFRRAEDSEFLLDGLLKAGLTAPGESLRDD
jgi:DNA-binding SARP family transcriptional activator